MSATSDVLRRAGLTSLAAWADQQLALGLSDAQLLVELRERPEYRQRFIGNELRRKRGLPMLSEGEYLSEEEGYRTALRNAGIDPRQFDSADDFASFIGGDIRADELKQRVELYRKVQDAGPRVKEAFARALGTNVSDQDLYDLATGQRPDLAQAYSNATGTSPFTNALTDAREGVRTATSGLTTLGVAPEAAQAKIASLTAARDTYQRRIARGKEMLGKAKSEESKKIWRARIAKAEAGKVASEKQLASIQGAYGTYTGATDALTRAQTEDEARLAQFSDFADTDPLALKELERAAAQVGSEEQGMYSSGGVVERTRTLREATY